MCHIPWTNVKPHDFSLNVYIMWAILADISHPCHFHVAICMNAPGHIPISPKSWRCHDVTSNAEPGCFICPNKLLNKQTVIWNVIVLKWLHCDVLYLCSGTRAQPTANLRGRVPGCQFHRGYWVQLHVTRRLPCSLEASNLHVLGKCQAN